MMLLVILAASVLCMLFLLRIASSPPFPLIARLFGAWADRCHNGPDLIGWPNESQSLTGR